MFMCVLFFLLGLGCGIFKDVIMLQGTLIYEKIKSFLPIFFLFAMLQGCSSEPAPDPGAILSMLESNRITGIANALFNARRFSASVYPNYNPQVRVDSTIQSGCPQGDGWASVDLVNENNDKIKIKCSTYSATIECMTEKDFLAREVFSSQEGHCNKDIPNSLPKLTN